jgi:GDP-4-dehydro-6-deoxy-D-mannose reductase
VRVLITGATGFAGRHLVDASLAAGDEVVALARAAGVRSWPDGVTPAAVDLLDADRTRAAIAAARPDVVYHLAALASVARSWEQPELSLRANPASTLNVLEAVRAEAPGTRVIVVGSGELYGPPERLPVDERALLNPQNPYAVSKAAADLLGGLYADAHDLAVIRARAFNHAGPGQSPTYAIASFARQVAAGELAGEDPIRIVTGNPHAQRDFTDVRDVVAAYRLLGAGDAPPGIYNICSGRAAPISELVELAGRASPAAVEHVVDQKLVRDHEVLEVRGSAERLAAATGWRPEIPLERTVADAVDWWRERLRAEATATRG